MSRPSDDPSATSGPLPEQVGAYRLEDPLLDRAGRPRTDAFRGWDERLHRPVLMRRVQLADPGRRQELRRRARALASLRH
ncbi:MAG: hypothetical protein AAGN46_06410, partial [Acidobacteriota bacterium]